MREAPRGAPAPRAWRRRCRSPHLLRGLAAGDDAACNRPAITLLRYDEDYSFLRDARCRTELWDPLKYLALSRGLPLT